MVSCRKECFSVPNQFITTEMRRYFIRSAAFVAMTTLSACTEDPLTCAEKYSHEFVGVAFLIGNEQLLFEGSDDCSVLVTIPQNDAQRLIDAAATSDYEGPIKPVNLSIRGKLKLERDSKGWVRIFHTEAINNIDVSVSKRDAQAASIIAFGSRDPNYSRDDVNMLP